MVICDIFDVHRSKLFENALKNLLRTGCIKISFYDVSCGSCHIGTYYFCEFGGGLRNNAIAFSTFIQNR